MINDSVSFTQDQSPEIIFMILKNTYTCQISHTSLSWKIRIRNMFLNKEFASNSRKIEFTSKIGKNLEFLKIKYVTR